MFKLTRVKETNNIDQPDPLTSLSIKRKIDDTEIDIQLSEQEVLDAFNHQEWEYHREDVVRVLTQKYSDGKIEEATLKNDEYIDNITTEYEEILNNSDNEWYDMIDEAIDKVS